MKNVKEKLYVPITKSILYNITPDKSILQYMDSIRYWKANIISRTVNSGLADHSFVTEARLAT